VSQGDERIAMKPLIGDESRIKAPLLGLCDQSGKALKVGRGYQSKCEFHDLSPISIPKGRQSPAAIPRLCGA
jgi:hypothetical protein